MLSGGDKLEELVGRPLELEDGKPPGIWSVMLYSVSFATIALLLWSSLAEIREVATTKGELVPAGQIKSVSHYEGGIVETILVQKGQSIKQGQALVRLQSKLVSSELNRLKARLLWLKLEAARLSAEVSGKKPDFSRFEGSAQRLIEVQQVAYSANVTNLEKSLIALDKRIGKRKLEIAAIEEEIASLRDEYGTRQSSYQMQEQLVGSGYTTQKEYLDRKATLQRAKTAIASAKVKLAEAKRGLSDDMHERARKITEDRKTNATQLAKITEEKVELQHLLEKHRDQFERLHIRSPISGVVKDVVPKSSGEVIQAGKLVAEIVPTDRRLIAEVKIQPKDIGHIKVGDKAELTVTTYDFNVYGKLRGQLKKVSASSFKDSDGTSYYLGEIALEGDNRTTYSRELDLMSGMLVEANIVTGSKSILKYILKPIYRSIDLAFSER